MSWLESAIQGTNNIGVALYQGWNANKMQDKANTENVELMREQNAFNERMMNQQNEYNSYQAQVQRALDAGLNPAYLFGEGASSAAVAPATGAAAPEIKPTSFGNSFIEALYKATSLAAGIKKNEAEIEKTNAESDSLKTANKFLEEREQATIANIKKNTEYTDAQKQEAEQNVKVGIAHEKELYKNIEVLDEQINLLIANKAFTDAKRDEIAQRLSMDERRLQGELEKWRHDNNRSDAEAALARKTIQKITGELKLQIKEGRKLDAALYQQTLDNALKAAKAELDMRDYELSWENPTLDYISRHVNGLISDVIQSIGGAGYQRFGGNPKERNERAHRRLNDFFDRSQSSYLYK